MKPTLIFFSRGAQPGCWRDYCAAGGVAAPLRVASLPQLRSIAAGTAGAVFWRGAGGAAQDVLAQFVRVLAQHGLAAIAAPAAAGAAEAAREALAGMLHAGGFATVASRIDGDTVWAVATRTARSAGDMDLLASRLMPALPAAAPREQLAALVRRLGAGDGAGAAAASLALLRRFPADGKLWDVHGTALLSAQRNEAALEALERACQLRPADPEAWEHRGVALSRLAKFALAAECFEHSLARNPGSAPAWSNAARNACASGDFPAAARFAERARELDPALDAANCNLGHALMGMQRPEEAEHCFRAALALQPDGAAPARRADSHGSLAMALASQGRVAEAAASFRAALALSPRSPSLHTGLLFCLSHDPGVTPAAAFAAHLAFGRLFAVPARVHANDRDPARRLRIGFVSGDLRRHAVAYFIEQVWAALDPAEVHLVAYASNRLEDDVSAALRRLCHAWRQVGQLDDDALAARIRADRIDVLFDLSGHTTHNRLPMFARKPAPLQVTWIGYPNTTGLAAMDYVLCDQFNAPHGLYEHLYTEKFARLPSSGSFAAPSGTPAPNSLPALATGRVTFGSFNRAEKIGEAVVAVWCRILHLVPGSRMLLGNMTEPGLQRTMQDWFALHGIGAERLVFHPALPRNDYLRLHHDVDIMLDAWPYTGGTTTNFALWMGVPVLTLRGPTRAHCQAAAVLGRMGLGDWVAQDSDAFVRLAVRWAHAPEALAALRAGMRARWETARLRQPGTVARGLELALRHMWRRWCAGLPPEHFDITLAQLPAPASTDQEHHA